MKKEKNEVKEVDISVSSLSEFISAISPYPSDRNLFRGENGYYSERIASSFRSYDGGWNSKKDKPFLEMSKCFYDEVAHRVSDFERSHFIAFSQHHGIPTNLLDITSSPLVALYFACIENENQTDQYGYVYIFDDNYIDITAILEKYPNENLLELVTNNNLEVITILTKLFEEYRLKHLESFNVFFDKLVENLLYYFEVESELSIALKDKKDSFNMKYHRIIMAIRKKYDGIMPMGSLTGNTETYAFMCLMRLYFILATSYQEPIHGINYLPNLYYRPLLIFDRGRSQNSSFIYQAYLSYIEPVYDYYWS